MNNVYDKLSESLEKEAQKTLGEAQKEWEKYSGSELALLEKMYISTSGIGTIIPLASRYKGISFIRDRTIELAQYYYVLTGDFNFEYAVSQ